MGGVPTAAAAAATAAAAAAGSIGIDEMTPVDATDNGAAIGAKPDGTWLNVDVPTEGAVAAVVSGSDPRVTPTDAGEKPSPLAMGTPVAGEGTPSGTVVATAIPPPDGGTAVGLGAVGDGVDGQTPCCCGAPEGATGIDAGIARGAAATFTKTCSSREETWQAEQSRAECQCQCLAHAGKRKRWEPRVTRKHGNQLVQNIQNMRVESRKKKRRKSRMNIN